MNIDHEYYEWLCDKIALNTKDRMDYTLLVRKLHSTPYVVTDELRVDAIRIRKAIELRSEFADSIDSIFMPIPEYPASCLEVLISLALDAERMIMRDGEFGDRTAKWFWEMIENLKLTKYTDDNFDGYGVGEILDRFIQRKYRRNGRGSIAFTTKKKHKNDFRKIDIWQQLNIWLSENYVYA